MFSNGVIARPESLSKILVNNHYLRFVQGVLLRKKATRDEGNLHCPKVVRTCRALIDLQLLPWRWIVSFHVDASPTDRSR